MEWGRAAAAWSSEYKEEIRHSLNLCNQYNFYSLVNWSTLMKKTYATLVLKKFGVWHLLYQSIFLIITGIFFEFCCHLASILYFEKNIHRIRLNIADQALNQKLCDQYLMVVAHSRIMGFCFWFASFIDLTSLISISLDFTVFGSCLQSWFRSAQQPV